MAAAMKIDGDAIVYADKFESRCNKITEEEMILKLWLSNYMCANLLRDVPPERQMGVAMALETQRLLNYALHKDAQFRRISIPMVRRIMEMPELTCKKRVVAHANKTSICMKMSLSLSDKFAMAMHAHNLDKEAEHVVHVVEALKVNIADFMKQFGKTSMLFLGLTVESGFLCYFYDWE